jgi:hypothetical protein
MSQDDAHFLSRINTRESSALTIATVASSSSLVVLALTVEHDLGVSHPWLPWFGLLFALLGFVYREVTIFSVDWVEHRKLSLSLRREIEEERSTAWTQVATFIRRFVIRFFLLLPFGAWIAFVMNLEANLCLELLLLVLLLFSMLLSLYHLKPEQLPTREDRTDS